MHAFYEKADKLSSQIISSSIEVHRIMGPGLLESIYERCLLRELETRNVEVTQQKKVMIEYKGHYFEESLRFDLLVGQCVLVEVKAVTDTLPIHKAQLLSYMKLLDIPLGLLINFHESRLVDGLSRLILPEANRKKSSLP